jgi:uncharacterized protein YifE (UPF0438 family)
MKKLIANTNTLTRTPSSLNTSSNSFLDTESDIDPSAVLRQDMQTWKDEEDLTERKLQTLMQTIEKSFFGKGIIGFKVTSDMPGSLAKPFELHRLCGRTFVGSDGGAKYNQANPVNQDCFYAHAKEDVFAICDGVSTCFRGELAANLLALRIKEHIIKYPPQGQPIDFEAIILAVHQELLAAGLQSQTCFLGYQIITDPVSRQKTLYATKVEDCELLILTAEGEVKFFSDRMEFPRLVSDSMAPTMSFYATKRFYDIRRGFLESGEFGPMMEDQTDTIFELDERERSQKAKICRWGKVISRPVGIKGKKPTIDSVQIPLEKGDLVIASSDCLGNNLCPQEIQKVWQKALAKDRTSKRGTALGFFYQMLAELVYFRMMPEKCRTPLLSGMEAHDFYQPPSLDNVTLAITQVK